MGMALLTMMRAAFCVEAGKFDVREVERPLPGPGEVVVRVRRCGVCGSDLHFFHGGFPPPPVCPGHEISGEVTDVGEHVERPQAGDRVAVEPLVVCGQCWACRT